jgi:hypothetical protein
MTSLVVAMQSMKKSLGFIRPLMGICMNIQSFSLAPSEDLLFVAQSILPLKFCTISSKATSTPRASRFMIAWNVNLEDLYDGNSLTNKKIPKLMVFTIN